MHPHDSTLRLALPKGRMQQGVLDLLGGARIHVHLDARGYRPSISLPDIETKMLKPQNIIEMLHAGSRDLGFAGADWVAELEADVVELLDTGLDPVRLVVAARPDLLVDGKLPAAAQAEPLIVASEYERLTGRWMRQAGRPATFLRSYGATEVFPPEDADCIVDITATGSTLKANRLVIVEELLRSSTRLYAHPRSLEQPRRRERIESLVLLLRSVLLARERVMVEVNVAAERLEALVQVLPCMKKPTLARLHGEDGYAVKAAIRRAELAEVIPALKARGGTDIVVYELSQIVP